jgi:hypothetical protein
MDTIKSFLAEKEVSTKNRDKRKHWDKEENVKGYYDIQNKKLKIKVMNARARPKEVANKKKELKLALLTKEAKIMSPLSPMRWILFNRHGWRRR